MTFINTLVLSQHEGGECLDDVVHIAKDKALRLVTNQQVPTPQAKAIINNTRLIACCVYSKFFDVLLLPILKF
jgi:hypothetical protein